MESDSKDIVKNGDEILQQVKDDPKPIQKSKRSNRRRPKESARERAPKKGELPTTLQPKFPSQRQLKKKKSDDDKVDIKDKDTRGEKEEDDGGIPMCPTDKILEDEEEVDRGEKEEQEEEQVDETQEPAPPDLPIVEYNPIKPTIIPEKPQKSVMKPRVKDGLSGRSEDRKTKKAALPAPSENETKRMESRKREGPHKKMSMENVSSDDAKRSVKKSKMHTKRMVVKPNAQKSVPPLPPTPAPSAPPPDQPQSPLPAQSPKPQERSLKVFGPEKSMDEKGRKHVPPPVQAPPPTTQYPTMKKDPKDTTKDQGSAGQKSKSVNATTSSQKLDQNATKKRKKKPGFLKNVYNKTKFWGRKSDCVTDPTTEMLARAYVPPDYSEKNALDFQPDIKNWFKKYNEEEYNLRCRTNQATKEKDIFVNNRPFWLVRQKEDEIPKVRIQMHRPLKQLYNKNPADILPKLTRTLPFLDPKYDNINRFKLVDKSIGVEELDSSRDKELTREAKDKAKEKELKRVSANTFHATMMFEVDKVAWDEQQKKGPDAKHDTKRRPQKKDQEQKSTTEDEGPLAKRLIWTYPEAPKDQNKVKMYKLQCYNRKARPILPVSSRKFWEIDYKIGEKKIPRKAPTAPSPSSSGTSLSTKSVSKSSSAEGRK